MSVESFPAPDALQAPPEVTKPAPEPLTTRTVIHREGARLSRWATAGAIAVLVLISLWLRTRALHVHYWVDEALSVGISSHPLSQLPGLLRQDGSPPLYYVLLHGWIALRGNGEVATHELSLIFALLTIPVAYWAGASLFDRRAGLIGAVLAAGAPYLTAYGQETRMYALLALLSLLVAASFLHVFVKRNRRYLPLFVVSLAASMYTHNWALFLAVMCGIGFLFCVREFPNERRALWRDGLLGFGGVLVLYAPWVPTVIYQARHTGAPWDLPPVVWSLTQGLYSLVGGRGAAVALLLAGGSGLLAIRRFPKAGSRLGLAIEVLLVLGIGTLLLAWLYSKTTPAWANRYLAVIVGPLILLFALGLARAARLGLVALVLVACFWVLDPVPTALDSKSNVAAAVAHVRRHIGSDALVLSTQPEQVPTLAYYLPHVKHFGTPLGPVPDPRVMDWRSALERFRHASPRRGLASMLRSVTPGERVVLVTPVFTQKSPVWFTLISRYTTRWSAALYHNPGLRLIAVSAPHIYSTGLAVRVAVYVKR
ncbi:MAG: glycosyltransferase family 39 protein [Solirubrobacterales bacterium]|nr:glycosyltransferase family 39 protein [Solirubrobacterales bacterium]MBV9421556.1 glycosyltransferase family 39 protein [Solirubrobacterales bacterium]MBV9799049.1 glycosyltransferase family 39 protein [Solirubrobacterales bacterium]